MPRIVEQNWDYTKHAEYYSYRPNYANEVIDMLHTLARKWGGGSSHQEIAVADIGAGTGNLSVMLLDRGCRVTSVEPNDAMRKIGKDRTQGRNIQWVRAIGIESTLKNEDFEWVTFGSSFNVMDRNMALRESHRILKTGGTFSAMWNHRDLNDPIQEIAEEVINDMVTNYSRGVRREDQRPILEANKSLFDSIVYLEQDFIFHQNIENYIFAWKSVKNPYWDLETPQGQELFEKIAYQLRHKLPSSFGIKYTTRAWSARKI